MKNNKNGGFSGFLFGKGFYAAMAVCLLGAVAAAWVTASSAIGSMNEQDEVPKPEQTAVIEDEYKPEDSLFAAEDVAKPKEDVKIEEPKKEENTFNFIGKGTKFLMPLEGEIIGEHSFGELVKYEALGEWRTHDGIDILAEKGAEIKASADGKITAVNNDPLWGTTVEIEHEKEITTIYCGIVPKEGIAAGKEVKSGDVIGTLGESNLAEAEKESHLHFSMKEKGKFIDPMTKIK